MYFKLGASPSSSSVKLAQKKKWVCQCVANFQIICQYLNLIRVTGERVFIFLLPHHTILLLVTIKMDIEQRFLFHAGLMTVVGAMLICHLWRDWQTVRRGGAHESRYSARVTCAVVISLVAVIFFAWGWYVCATVVHRRSWGVFGGNCFEVVETGAPGCQASYTDDTTVTLSVR